MTTEGRMRDLEDDIATLRDRLNGAETLREARRAVIRAFDEYEGEVEHAFLEEHKSLSTEGTVNDFLAYMHDVAVGDLVRRRDLRR